MAIEDPATPIDDKPQREEEEEEELKEEEYERIVDDYLNESGSSDDEAEKETEPIPPDASSSDSDSDYFSEYDYDDYAEDVDSVVDYTRPGVATAADGDEDEKNAAEANVRAFIRLLNSPWVKMEQEEDENRKVVEPEELYDFPKDEEGWTEEDLREMWADAPLKMTKSGWDPVFAEEEDWQVMREEAKEGRDPPIAPFYLPYRKPFPVIPDNHADISTPKAVVEELDRIEEFLKWVSYIFPDGSSYVLLPPSSYFYFCSCFMVCGITA